MPIIALNPRSKKPAVNPCAKPTGWIGRLVLRNMNARHSKVTDWGLSHIVVGPRDIALDVGCGGGRTVSKLAVMANEGKVYGIDYSPTSVAVAIRVNKEQIKQGRVEIREASVSQLPFSNNFFDLITAVETHFWWPDIPAGIQEIFRVLKPGSKLIIIAEVFKGATSKMAAMVEKYLPTTGMAFLTVDEHRALFADAGYTDVQVSTDNSHGWICCVGCKP